MVEHYGELKLYFAYVSDACRGEGRFEREPTSEWSRRTVAQSRKLIEQYLQPRWEFGLHMGYCDDGVASNEQEALFLITHAETNIKNASGLVVPYDRIHGSTRFYRVIHFAGATGDQSDEIISIMKQSGHIPCKIDQYCKIDQFSKSFRDDVEERFQKENDRRWRAALKFYP